MDSVAEQIKWKKGTVNSKTGNWNYPIRGEKKRMKKSEDSFRELWDSVKQTNICITGVPE